MERTLPRTPSSDAIFRCFTAYSRCEHAASVEAHPNSFSVQSQEDYNFNKAIGSFVLAPSRDMVLQRMHRLLSQGMQSQASRPFFLSLQQRVERKADAIAAERHEAKSFLSSCLDPGLYLRNYELGFAQTRDLSKALEKASDAHQQYFACAGELVRRVVDSFPLSTFAGLTWSRMCTRDDLMLVLQDPNRVARKEAAMHLWACLLRLDAQNELSSLTPALFDLSACTPSVDMPAGMSQAIGFDEIMGMALPLHRYFSGMEGSKENILQMKQRVLHVLWPHIQSCFSGIDVAAHRAYMARPDVAARRPIIEQCLNQIESHATQLLQPMIAHGLRQALQRLLVATGQAALPQRIQPLWYDEGEASLLSENEGRPASRQASGASLMDAYLEWGLK